MADVGGDPACWLDRVCEVCGAFLEDAAEHECPNAQHADVADD